MASTLFDHQRQAFSQSGEDGIIGRVFDVVGAGDRLCCEFGAWDGIHYSNTRALILDGWSALLIEGDAGRFGQLRDNYRDNSAVTCAFGFVDAG